MRIYEKNATARDKDGNLVNGNVQPRKVDRRLLGLWYDGQAGNGKSGISRSNQPLESLELAKGGKSERGKKGMKGPTNMTDEEWRQDLWW